MITLEQIRTHCRIDGHEEDDLLEQYRLAALETLQTHTGRQWYAAGETPPVGDERALQITPQVVQALLLLVGGWYAARESSTAGGEIPAAFWHLIQPYRIYGV